MDIEEIRQGFLQAYQNSNRISCVLPPDAPRKYKYRIFPLLCLDKLLNEIQQSAFPDKSYDPLDDDFNHNYGARFIVDVDKEIKFSFEGCRSSSVPAHTDMANRVLSAGNIYFSEDYSKIVGISNKSGHFLPDFSTLVFAIPLILVSDFPLSDLLQIKNEKTGESMMLSKAELMDLLPLDLKADLTQWKQKNLSEDILVYESFSNENTEQSMMFSNIELMESLPLNLKSNLAQWNRKNRSDDILAFQSFTREESERNQSNTSSSKISNVEPTAFSFTMFGSTEAGCKTPEDSSPAKRARF